MPDFLEPIQVIQISISDIYQYTLYIRYLVNRAVDIAFQFIPYAAVLVHHLPGQVVNRQPVQHRLQFADRSGHSLHQAVHLSDQLAPVAGKGRLVAAGVKLTQPGVVDQGVDLIDQAQEVVPDQIHLFVGNHLLARQLFQYF
ncbi:hypothetical protein Psfp_02020 [Pelotomaculum sp. FP]|nr:hypothetical protein Psfp_02020 [Pelotomaculum sp. FP]